MQNFQNLTDSVTVDVQKARFSELLARLSQFHEDPIEGMAGYLVTEDPTYLPDDPHIKILIRSAQKTERTLLFQSPFCFFLCMTGIPMLCVFSPYCRGTE